jgi:dihydrofolate reductase
MIKAILAIDESNAIGWSDGRLPWQIPIDMKRFKELTTGHTVLMGFNTFKSLNRPQGLPNRKNLVLTRKPWSEARDFIKGDVDVISSLNWVTQPIEKDGVTTTRFANEDLWIIGGSQVYTKAIEQNIIDELHITLVHESSGADVKLKDELYYWKLFMIRQRSKGINWVLEWFCCPNVEAPSPRIAIIVLRKQ